MTSERDHSHGNAGGPECPCYVAGWEMGYRAGQADPEEADDEEDPTEGMKAMMARPCPGCGVPIGAGATVRDGNTWHLDCAERAGLIDPDKAAMVRVVTPPEVLRPPRPS